MASSGMPDSSSAHQAETTSTSMADATMENEPAIVDSADVDEVPQILPKGIVANTSEIYDEVASYRIVPLERLQEYWRGSFRTTCTTARGWLTSAALVYTTTHRRLYDPTASRLENFWWHVWGSDRRNLSGKTLARLYENISNGPTFVPLRGPSNRYEGPMVSTPECGTSSVIFYLHIDTRIIKIPLLFRGMPAPFMPEQQGATNETGSDKDRVETLDKGKQVASEPPSELKPSTQTGTDEECLEQEETENAETETAVQPKKISSSSTRPPPSQSILKKPRPSLSGPGSRPTPRFALPSGAPSEGEPHRGAAASDDIGEGSAASEQSAPKERGSKSGGVKHDARKAKAKPVKKKFVASVSSSKRKAVVAKRTNSHSSTGSAGVAEASGARELIAAPRHSEEALIEDEPMSIIASPVGVPSRGANVLPRADGSAPNVARQAAPPAPPAPPKSTRAARKQPMPPQSLRPQLYTSSPTSVSTAASVRSVAGSASATAGRGQRPVPVQQRSRQPAAPGSLGSSGGSVILDMPFMATRNRQAASQALASPGGTSRRQFTLPTVPSERKMFAAGQGSALGGAIGLGSPPAPSTADAIPPRLSRSLSQDSYGRQHLGFASQRPGLPGIGSAVTAAPSMVAASGELIDTEGPDPFELYAQTGLDDTSDTDRPTAESSSYNEHSPVQRQFTPTRPSQTPRIPFARTRSQLNIILDREKERLGQGNFTTWQESRNRDHHGDDQRPGR